MNKILSKYFSKDQVNTNRQLELDIAKAVMIVIMIMSHVLYYYMYCIDMELSNPSISGYVYYVLAGHYCAPLFMICMGIGISYSKKNSSNDIIIRGLKLLLTGFILDLFRGFIPYLIENFLYGEIVITDALLEFTAIDILQFSGFAFILIGLLKKFKLSNIKIFIISIIMGTIATFINNQVFINDTINHVLDIFFRIDFFSFFPLFTWFIFPCFGMLFGDMYK